jgi:acyl-CoA reductase-like NAD-dependent aldehyde dehydrogenase
VPRELPYYLGNRPQRPNAALSVFDKYSGAELARVPLADRDAVDAAITLAAAAAPAMRELPADRREAILLHLARRCEQRADELTELLCAEAGKPIAQARGEVLRMIDTVRYAAGEALRIGGELMNLEISPRARGYHGAWRRAPIGPCAFITPFNFPLNLVAHKVAPALAIGCPFVLKPASVTPLSALLVGEILAETDLPPGAFSILPAAHAAADALITDDRIRLISFTGSGEVGWSIKRRAGRAKVSLELGGNAAVIVDRDADLADAAARILLGAFGVAGQSCISVQRIIAHQEIYAELRDRLVEGSARLRLGDPRDPATDVGPMISEAEAERVIAWVDEARLAGARLLCGGARDRALVAPTLLEGVDRRQRVVCGEVFGPVAVLSSFTDFDAALAEVNDSVYGLQAGLFTRDLYKVQRAWSALDVGGLIIGDVPTWRVEHMPYGGVKESGAGREGLRFAIESMSELRLLVVRDRPAL